jgi:uncharacterized membrane protein
MNITTSGVSGLAMLVTVAGIASASFWMVVGWRAMRAHERLAEAAEQAARAHSGTHPLIG